MFGLNRLRSRKEQQPSEETCRSRVLGASRTDVGRVRSVNEDSVYFQNATDNGSGRSSSALALVADGLGGAQGGSVASTMVTQIVSQDFHGGTASPPKVLRKALESANREIFRKAQREKDLAGMASTCVALALAPPFAWAAWVGDSRLYLIRDRQIFQMTEDHSVVQEMVRRGLLSSEQAADHEERNLVTRSLGSQRKVEVAVWDQPFPIRSEDRFLLSTDGLHDSLTSPELLEIASCVRLDTACEHLIEAANSRGGHDNISAVLLEVSDSRRVAAAEPPPTREFRITREVNS